MSGNDVPSPRSSTDRVRLHRQRRAAGIKYVISLRVEVTSELVASLIRRGLLIPAICPDGSRVTRHQIKAALEEALACLS